MTNESVSHFLDLVKRAGLISAESLQSLQGELQSAPSQASAASLLVEKKLLTPFQAERLLQGMPDDLVLADRYQLLEKIGSGGMGAVYRAKDTRLNRIVAIKLMAPHNLNQPDAVVRFKREARALAQLALPHIVQAFDSGEDRGRNFLVMEYVQGIGLDKVLREKGKIPPTVAADYVYQTAIGMQRAHERGMIHRDIKPGNLLLTPEGDIKILDLGLARFLQDQLPDGEVTRDNIGMGTPDYMPPEQFRDAHNVDPRADIYSLGCTLYHLVAGRPPFPGSSLSDKMEAHSSREAPPLSELAPEIPAGLMRTIERMMAKRPVDRIPRMSEVAEALAPYVAGSSPSLPSVNQTLTWQATQLRGAKRRSSLMLAGLGALLVLVTALALWGVPRLWKKDEQPIAKVPSPSPGPVVPATPTPVPVQKPSPPPTEVTPPTKGKDEPDRKAEPEKKTAPPRVVTIPNGVTVAQDGTGQYKTILEALDNIEEGQTIRVLDNGMYAEPLFITQRKFNGLTLEAVNKATLVATEGTKNLITISDVSHFTLRGFRLHAQKQVAALVWMRGASRSLTIEGNEFSSGIRGSSIAVEYTCNLVPDSVQPTIVRNNSFRDLGLAFAMVGAGQGPLYHKPFPNNRVRFEDNRIQSCSDGVIIVGAVRQAQIVGNQFVSCSRLALELENLLPGAEDILIANNTAVDCGEGLRIWDEDIRGKNITFCNNLLLGIHRDMVFYDSGGNPSKSQSAGDGKLVISRWNLFNNWREQKDEENPIPGWVPRAKQDRILPSILVHSRKSGDKNFLRPANDSPLAKEGAGKSNRAFPSHVGAVAPEGADPWNWQRTWDLFFEKRLTVSKSPKDGAMFSTLRDAVASAGPGVTIQILDDAIYSEIVTLDDPVRHRGLTVEAPKGATLELQEDAVFALRIDSVADVTLRGLNFRAKGVQTPFITFLVQIEGNCPNTVCERLTADTHLPATAIAIKNTPLKPDDEPIVIRHCKFKVGGTGVLMSGLPEVIIRRVLVHDNHIQASKAVSIELIAEDVLVAGNILARCPMACIELRGLAKEAKNLIFANNSCFGGQAGVRIWMDREDKKPYTIDEFSKGQVELLGNVILRSQLADIVLIDANDPRKVGPIPGDFLLERWVFDSNWRDLKGDKINPNLPRGDKDQRVSDAFFQSLAPSHADFLKPIKGSELRTGGVGKTKPGLPAYAGALPEDGVPAWDWRETWRVRFGKK